MENPLELRATSFELRKQPSAISHQELSHKAIKRVSSGLLRS
jgi:hypothetical protein